MAGSGIKDKATGKKGVKGTMLNKDEEERGFLKCGVQEQAQEEVVKYVQGSEKG